jgi:hypothetical protein
VNHRIFERILRPRLRPRACLPQRRVNTRPTFPLLGCEWSGADLAVPALSQFIVIRPGLAEVQRFVQGPAKGRSWLGSDAKRLAVGLGPGRALNKETLNTYFLDLSSGKITR